MQKVLWLVWKDITMEMRSRGVMGAMVLFSLVVLVIFAFSFIQPGTELPLAMLPGMIWVTIAFAGMLGLNQAFWAEKQNEALMGLLLAPLSKTTIYLGKVVTHFILLIFLELITIPLFFVFFNLTIKGVLLQLVPIILLGTWGFSGLGVFLSALSMHTKSNELLLPVILFPLLIPLFLAGVKATAVIFSGLLTDPLGLSLYWSWFRLLLVFDIITFTLSLILIDYVMEV